MASDGERGDAMLAMLFGYFMNVVEELLQISNVPRRMSQLGLVGIFLSKSFYLSSDKLRTSPFLQRGVMAS